MVYLNLHFTNTGHAGVKSVILTLVYYSETVKELK